MNTELDAIDDMDRVFIAKEKPTPEQLRAAKMRPAEFGWMTFQFPVENGSSLMLGDFAVKSDWFDKETGTIRENNDLPKVYSALRADLRKRLMAPIWAINLKTGGIAKYPGIAYSSGASQWEARGNELRQQGVQNVRFSSNSVVKKSNGN